jgi:hypothetical protein
MDRFYKYLLVFIYELKKSRTLRKKAGMILDNQVRKRFSANVSSDLKKDFRRYWKGLASAGDKIWLSIYINASGIEDYRYIPETVYYNRAEPSLNNKAFSKAYSDKNFYDSFLDFNLPQTYFKNIEGVFYDSGNNVVDRSSVIKSTDGREKIIIKPSVESGGGRNVLLCHKEKEGFRSTEGLFFSTEQLLAHFGRDFIIQEVVESHPFYSRYNATSLNTIRILTYRSISEEKIHALHNILRAGKTGSITDNQASGGYACGLTSDGCLTGKAVDKYGNVYNAINGITLEPGKKTEGFDRISAAALDIAARFPYSRLLGLDLCLDSQGKVRLIEVNNVNNEINFYQMLDGPLFRDFTDEVISICRSGKRSFLIDFDI